MTDYRPTIPPKVRDWAYFVLLGGSALALAAQGLAPVWAGEVLAGKVVDSAQVLVSILALVGGGLGVTYRPGKLDPLESVRPAKHRATEDVLADEGLPTDVRDDD